MAISSYLPPIDPAKRLPGRALWHDSAIRKVAILGFGTVGSAVARILCDGTHPHLQLTYIFNRNIARKRQAWVPAEVRWTENIEDILQSDVDLVVEVVGGLEPAGGWIRQVLRSGKSVVTANKHLVASQGIELGELARGFGQHFEYGASVAGGIPVLNAIERGLAGEKLRRFEGVLNGTCNYILSNMELQGLSLKQALKQAQQLGYAEADPSDDVNGIDARCKLAILVRTGFGLFLAPEQIPSQSILDITREDFRQARKLGCTIRQIAIAERKSDQLRASVQPMLVPRLSVLGQVRDNQNALVSHGEWGGETMFVGRGAGGGPTAVAVVSDMLGIAKQMHAAPGSHAARVVATSDELAFAHYVRMNLVDRHQGITAVQTVLSGHGIAIKSTLREPGRTCGYSFTVEPCAPQKLRLAGRECLEKKLVREAPVELAILT